MLNGLLITIIVIVLLVIAFLIWCVRWELDCGAVDCNPPGPRHVPIRLTTHWNCPDCHTEHAEPLHRIRSDLPGYFLLPTPTTVVCAHCEEHFLVEPLSNYDS